MLRAPRNPAQRTVGAIVRIFDCSVNREWGGLPFRARQVLTGHGFFGHYLYLIGKEKGADCYYCSVTDDTAQHTLVECPVWVGERDLTGLGRCWSGSSARTCPFNYRCGHAESGRGLTGVLLLL
ncbi:hypothetical protein KM043_000128 [Ampulex compressa]|nr:hypothetical protein KM043_000128 [Ampulex compressa]